MIEMADRCGAEVILTSQLKRTADHQLFDKSINRKAGRKQGFWVFTTERFFYLEEAMRHLGIERLLHLESDNLIFFDVAAYEERLTALYSGLAAPFLNDNSCVPGVFFVGALDALVGLNGFIARRVARERRDRPLIARLRSPRVRMGTPLNDMNLLAAYRDQVGEQGFELLPTSPPAYEMEWRARPGPSAPGALGYSRGHDTLGMVFDAAAIGQYLMGMDRHFHPRATGMSHINRNAMLDPRDFEFELVKDERGRVQPTMQRGGVRYRIGSIHNHSKVNFFL
ncbi:hypothetical protein [Devosia sp.]|uniref:hypothetical protein n=1 Tax=Devosia sp. TaxID=1871048 RepID=UPI00261A7601|nr:hypothetical protein [Devosia sp.]